MYVCLWKFCSKSNELVVRHTLSHCMNSSCCYTRFYVNPLSTLVFSRYANARCLMWCRIWGIIRNKGLLDVCVHVCVYLFFFFMPNIGSHSWRLHCGCGHSNLLNLDKTKTTVWADWTDSLHVTSHSVGLLSAAEQNDSSLTVSLQDDQILINRHS